MQKIISLCALLAVLPLSVVQAEESVGRYQLQPSGEGFLRLDTVTGEVSVCQQKQENWSCRLAADERAAFERELDLLTTRVEKLEKSPSTLGKALPSTQEMDQGLAVMEHFMRGFMGIVRELDSKPLPQKT